MVVGGPGRVAGFKQEGHARENLSTVQRIGDFLRACVR